MTYYPRRPVKSFQDLEVYQKLLAIAVVIVKRTDQSKTSEVLPSVSSSSTSEVRVSLVRDLHECALSLPIKIAAAHSLRFGNTDQAIRILEEIMVGCNKIVVYLELYRDLYNEKRTSEVEERSGKTSEVKEIEHEFFEEQIKNILSTRFKILHLQRSWIKFTPSGAKTDK